MTELEDVGFRFFHVGSGLWVASTNSHWGAVEFMVNGTAEAPDPAELEMIGRFLENAEARVLALRKQISFAFCYRPIRVAINRERRIGVQFQHRFFPGKREMIMEATAA